MPCLRPFLLMVIVLATIGGTIGCGPDAESVVECNGKVGWVRRAPSDGTYVLRETCPSRSNPFQGPTVELRRNDPLGFHSDGPGLLEAVAGRRRFPIPPGREYVWLRNVSGAEKVGRGVVTVGMVAFAIIALPVEIPMLIINPIRC